MAAIPTVPFAGLPDSPALSELKTKDQWVAWKYVERNGRTTKPPVNPKTGGGASHSDPSTWGTYDQAAAFATEHGLPGVGFVLSDSDDFTGIDLDKCISADGKLAAWAECILLHGETYAEISPSGRGLRLIARGKVDKTVKCDPAGVEVYRNLRYLTITGHRHPYAPAEINAAPLTLTELAERVAAVRPEVAAPPKAETTTTRTDFIGQVNKAALARLPEWVPNLFPGATFHKSTGAFRVSSDDLGRGLEEDLSIAPNGIKDFGLHDTGDPREGKRTATEIVMEHGDLGADATESDAAFWLCKELGADPKELGFVTAADDFGTVDIPPPPPFPLITAVGAANQALPPRQWLYGYLLSRKYVGILASPGGVGKTAYTFGAAIAMASGQSLLHDAPHKPLKVWLYNLEDDIIELRRRIQAAGRHYDASEETLSRIVLSSGRDRPLQLVAQQEGRTMVGKDVALLIETLKANAIDVLILDPLVNAHSIPENDNEAAAKLMRVVARIADEANCAIWLVHHTRKGFVAGEADSIRGGSPLVANARGAHTLAPMSVDEAKLFGVPEDERKRYVKLDDAKANMAISSGRGKWMHLQSVALGNGDSDYPSGDSVQVVVKWTPPQALDGLAQSDIRKMLSAIEEGPGGGELFARSTQGGNSERWAGNVLVNEFDRTIEQAKAFLKTAEQKGWIKVEEYASPATRKPRKGVVVYLANVPEDTISELDEWCAITEK